MHRLPSRLITFLAAGLIVAACGSSGPSSLATTLVTPEPSSAPSSAATQEPTGTSTPEPVATPALSAGPTQEPTPEPTASPGDSGTPGASATPGDLAACSGSDGNRAFLADTAAAFSWEVYCASLPSGWYIYDGRYRGASGGWMEIFYRTSGELRFQLREGGFCTGTPAECAPRDANLGSGSFGDLTGELTQYAGNYVLYVNPGQLPAYQATGVGLDEATFRAFLEALIKVPG